MRRIFKAWKGSFTLVTSYEEIEYEQLEWKLLRTLEGTLENLSNQADDDEEDNDNVKKQLFLCATALHVHHAFKVTRPSFFGEVPFYCEALWYPHLHFYRKSNT